MQILITYRGGLYEHIPQHITDQSTLTVSPGTTVRDIIDLLAIPDHAIWFATINDKKTTLCSTVSDNDHLTIYAPVAGG